MHNHSVDGALRPELQRNAIVRLALTYSVATNCLVLTPFIVAALMSRFQLGDDVATQIAGIEILGIALSCALLPKWITRFSHIFIYVGVLGTIAGQAISLWAPKFLFMSVARGMTGICEGILFVIVASSVSHRKSADRLWGQINLVAGGINGSILVLVSYLPETWLGQYIFMLLAATTLLMTPAIIGTNKFTAYQSLSTMSATKRVTQKGGNKIPMKLVFTIWVVTVLVYGGQSSQWAVAGIVGSRIGLSGSTVGTLLSLSSLLGFSGALIPSHPKSHQHRLKLIWLAQLLLIGSIIWFFESTGHFSFFFSQLLLNCAFFVIVPFLTGLLSENDPDGSLVARTVVVTFIGAGIGTAIAGSLFDRFGGIHFSYGLCIGIAASLPFVYLALRKARPGNAEVSTLSTIN